MDFFLANWELWFDVGRIQETTQKYWEMIEKLLWFDVERIQETTGEYTKSTGLTLWFDVEWIQETTKLVSSRL